MINPKARERLAFYAFVLAGFCLLLTLPLVSLEITRRQLGLIRFAMAICLTGAVLFLSGLFTSMIKPVTRAALAIPLCALFWFINPVLFFVKAPGTVQQAVLYVRLGDIIDNHGKNVGYLYDLPIKETFRKHGANPPEARLIAFSSPEAALWNAREILSELQELVKDAQYKSLRVGLAYGPTQEKNSQLAGPTVNKAKQIAENALLDEAALNMGIFLGQAFADQLKDSVKHQYALIRLSPSGAQDPIYSMSLVHRQFESSARRQVSHEVSSYDNVFLVCAAVDLTGSKREVSKDQTDRRLRWIADTQLGPLLTSLNEFEGFFPGEVNYLIFPSGDAALRASEQILKASRNSGLWDDHLTVKVFVSIHSGSIQFTAGNYFGATMENARKLTRESLAGEGIALSSEAYRALRSLLKPRAVEPNENSDLGKFYVYRPRL